MIEAVRIIPGDVLAGLRTLPAASVHCCVTSPPYWGLRDYGAEGQIGLEPTPAEYLSRMVVVFREVRRVLRDDGTCWVNMGDGYAGSWGAQSRGDFTPGTLEGASSRDVCLSARQIMAHPKETCTGSLKNTPGLKAKDLIGMPWRLAFALQADGWWLRSDIIWAKPNPMPESVTDRPTKSHEYVFLLAKSERYFYDAEAIKEGSIGTTSTPRFGGSKYGDSDDPKHATKSGNEYQDTGRRNARTVWTITTQPYPEAHFATFPEALPERCIKAGTSEKGCCAACGAPWVRKVETHNPSKWAAGEDLSGGAFDNRTANPQSSKSLHRQAGGVYSTAKTVGWRPSCDCGGDPVPCVVLDPFLGSGTTIAVARKLGRRGIGCELNPEYIALARERIGRAERPNTYRSDHAAPAPLFGVEA